MAEGVYPKDTSANGILYPSEVNEFANSGRFVSTGSFGFVVSGTASQTVGSVVIPAGSLTNPCKLVVDFRSTLAGNVNNQVWSLVISGASSNGSVPFQQNGTSSLPVVGQISILAGSPLAGYLYSNSGEIGTTYSYRRGGLVPHLNTSQATVLLWKVVSAGSTGLPTFTVHTFGERS